MKERSKDFEVVAIGNAVIDLITEVEEEFLTKHSLEKSTMTLVTEQHQQELLADVTKISTCAGGSAGNSIRTLGLLGINSGFIGTVSNDEYGILHRSSMLESGVEPLISPLATSVSTGICAIFVTPDSERTMCTHIGASELIETSHLSKDTFNSTEIFFIEGYQFDTDKHKQAIVDACDLVRENNGKIALTLSDVFCVKNHKTDFLNIVLDLDILFCNENEFNELFDVKFENLDSKNLEQISKKTKAIIIVTRSEKGCVIIQDSNSVAVPAKKPAKLVDATGAGDQFAAGYLFGLIKGETPQRSAGLGIELATIVIAKLGPGLTPDETASATQNWLTISTNNAS